MVTKNSYQQLNGSQYGWASSPLGHGKKLGHAD